MPKLLVSNRLIILQGEYRTGRESEKEKVVAILKNCYKKANSPESFFQFLKKSGLKTYERSGKTTGVVVSNYKFRFNRLGFTNDKLDNLFKFENRDRGLKHVRMKDRIKLIDR